MTATASKSTAWQKYANCDGLNRDQFFTQPGPASIAAKRICRGCEVRDECLTYSNTAPIEEQGVWGGLDEEERRTMRAARRRRKPESEGVES